jgi:hypothetical protein
METMSHPERRACMHLLLVWHASRIAQYRYRVRVPGSRTTHSKLEDFFLAWPQLSALLLVLLLYWTNKEARKSPKLRAKEPL